MWRWTLPFIIPLVIASTLAYALDGALVATAEADRATSDVGDSAPAIADVCTSTMMYIGLNSYVPVRSANSCGSFPP
jgi:hypothetical protein